MDQLIKALVIIPISISINYLFSKYNILIDDVKKSIHKSNMNSINKIPLSGGIIFLISFFLINFDAQIINLFLFLMLFIGILSDTNTITSPIKRLFLQIIVVVSFIVFTGTNVETTNLDYLDIFLENYFFSIFFTSFCFLVLINGSNFIDGINSLVLGYYTIVIIVLIYISNNANLSLNFNLLSNLVFIFFIMFLFNLFEKNFLGDSGSYCISFLVGYLCINFAIQNPQVSPFFIALILWYPAWENLFSILRRLKKNFITTEPDKMHLHHIIFLFLKEKIHLKKIYTNSLTGILINTFNLLIFLIGSKFYKETNILVLLTLFSVLTYIGVYKLLSQK
tara:strand:+ start:777 stop:1787 length:1011 start_codon:yes stop_codon:yes gene_type:complete